MSVTDMQIPGPVISARGITKDFGAHVALKNIDLELGKGQSLVIIGPNGAGKTTLLKVLSGTIAPTQGTLLIQGVDIKKDPMAVKKMIGVISHETYLYDELTARENLEFFGKMYGIQKDVLEKRIDELLLMTGLDERADDRAGSFSRGMKQRLSIIRSLLHRPAILLMDEPYTGLDQQAADAFEAVLRLLDTEMTTKIMVSHDIERAFEMSDRIIIMDKGMMVHDAMKAEIANAEGLRWIYRSIFSVAKNDRDKGER